MAVKIRLKRMGKIRQPYYRLVVVDSRKKRDGKVIETLSDGGIFGEMALIDGSPRSATALAKTDAEVAPINEKSFLFLVHETPFFAIAVMRTLAERLRRAVP